MLDMEEVRNALWKEMKGKDDLYIGKTCEEADSMVKKTIENVLRKFEGAGFDYILEDGMDRVEGIVLFDESRIDNAALL